QAPQIPGVPKGSALDDFLKQLFGEEKPSPATDLSMGTGFFISPAGYIVTSKHVIANAEDIFIVVMSGEKFAATVLGIDPRTDIALLKIMAETRTFPYVAFADADGRVGDWILAVGNAFGLGGTVTAGIISGQHRDIGEAPYDYLQIDANVNQG